MTLQSRGRASAPDPEVAAAIERMAPWFHNLHLPDGSETAADHPLGDFPAFKWDQLQASLPADLSGARALDIGCNAGFYSFQLAARGAEVLALDIDEHYLAQARWAAQHLDPDGRIEFRQGTVYDLARLGRRFDVILFLGVLYHLRHPLLALDLVASLLDGQLVLQTLTMPGGSEAPLPEDLPFERRQALTEPSWPRAAFIERRLAGDPTNWWAPDDACVKAMARSAGLRVVATPGHELYVCEPDPQPGEGAEQRALELAAVLGRDPSASGSARPSS